MLLARTCTLHPLPTTVNYNIVVQHPMGRSYFGSNIDEIGSSSCSQPSRRKKTKRKENRFARSAEGETIVAKDAFLYEEHKDKRVGMIKPGYCQVRSDAKSGTGAQVGAHAGD